MKIRKFAKNEIVMVFLLILMSCDPDAYRSELEKIVDLNANSESGDVEKVLKPPVLYLQQSMNNSIMLKWHPVDGADSYEVWKSDEDDQETSLLYKSTSENYMLVENLYDKSGYRFWIRSCAGDDYSEFDKTRRIIPLLLECPVLQKSDYRYHKKISVKWNEIGSADGYIVYYSFTQEDIAKGNCSTKETSSLSSSISVTRDQPYYVAIQAFNDVCKSPISEIISVEPHVDFHPPEKVFIKEVGAEILLSWDFVDNVDFYIVFKGTCDDFENASHCGMVSTNRFIFTDYLSSTQYWYWIICADRDGETSFVSDSFTMKTN